MCCSSTKQPLSINLIKSNLFSPWHYSNLKIAIGLSFFPITCLLVTVINKSLQTGTENPDWSILGKLSFVLIGHFSFVPVWPLSTSFDCKLIGILWSRSLFSKLCIYKKKKSYDLLSFTAIMTCDICLHISGSVRDVRRCVFR